MVVDNCNCNEMESPNCELKLNKEIFEINCKSDVSSLCRSAVENWAELYRTASNANDTICKFQDPNYKISQKTWKSCSSELQGTSL